MKQLRYLLLGTICIFACTACTDGFESANTNPNRVTVEGEKLQATSMFEPLLYGGANFFTYYSWYWCDELIQRTAHTAGTTRQQHRYFIADQDWQNVWNTYSRYASNDYNMYKLAVKQNNVPLQAVALTLKVLFMSNLTDIYGDIPYAEAFKADQGIQKPVFDSQESVYQQMFADLEAANKIYATSPYVDAGMKSMDGMYGFDMLKWQKFNNALYLRLLCRISGRAATVVDGSKTVAQKMQQIVDEPATYPIFESNADNATVKYTGAEPYKSEFDPAEYTTAEFTSAAYRITEQTVKMMNIKDPNNEKIDKYTDPRLKIIAVYSGGSYNYWKGTVAGCEATEQDNVNRGSSMLNYANLVRANSDEWFMDYSEVQFILAEAALKGNIRGGADAAKQYYEQAIKSSMQKWSNFASAVNPLNVISDDDTNAFLQSDLASWDNADDKSELIANQKYLALFWVGMEAWHEYRRTGFPSLTIGKGCTFNDMILPTRFAYPNTTMATNSENAKVALQRMGGDNTMKTPVWWSKQAIESGK